MSFESAMNAVSTPTPSASQAPGAEGGGEAAADLSQALEKQGAPGAAAADAPPPEPRPESASTAFQAIAKERKRALQLQRQLKEREAQLAERERKLAEFEGKPTAKPKTPLEALQAAGFSYEDATNFLLNNNQLTADQQVKSVRDEIAELKREQAEREKRATEESQKRAQSEQSQRVQEFKEEIADYVGSNGETYELLSQEDPGEVQGLIYNLIAQAYSESVKASEETGETPRILSVKEGADLAEKYYEERLEKFYRTKKIQSKFAPKATETAQKPAQSAGNPSKTLSQAQTSGSASPSSSARSEDDRMKRALEALERMGR